MRDIDQLIIHCSDTPDDRHVTVADIDDWHKQRGWSKIGYHYVIYRDGSIHAGRPVAEVGAHCYGQNHGSIGICVIGRKDFAEVQFESLRNLVATLKNIFSGVTIHPHNEYDKGKTCPNFDIDEVLV